jgi:polysaccharide pyruvyl transferase WcaK-like protein
VITGRDPGPPEPPAAAPRVGLFGLFGAGNVGNDASFEVVLNYLRSQHPDSIIDAMCSGPQRLGVEYGIETSPLTWHHGKEDRASGVTAIILKALGKIVDTFKTAAWVRRHDVVIVPGTGVLEASLPVRPWETPYAMFLLCVFGRIFGTKVALVSVGANPVNQRLTRWLLHSAATLSFYRSFRDVPSRDAVPPRKAGDHDEVYPDLVFGFQTPPDDPGHDQTVGVGVMAYVGGNDDRRQSDELHDRYVDAMEQFVLWLVDTGHRVRLFWGDDIDGLVAQEIMSHVRACRPDLEPTSVAAEPFSSLVELMGHMVRVGTVVGTRYHNVLCALKLSKPTISIGYSAKHDALMAEMGLPEFSQSARSLNAEQLIAQFAELERRAGDIRPMLTGRNRAKFQGVEDQFSVLSSRLFPDHAPTQSLVAASAGRSDGPVSAGATRRDPNTSAEDTT